MKYWLEDEHTVCFVSESGFSRVAFNFLNSSITRGPPIPFNFLKYWLTFNLISSTVEKSTFLSSSTALLSWRPSVVPTKDMMKFLTHARAWYYKICTLHVVFDYIKSLTLMIRGRCMVLWCIMMNYCRQCWGISTFFTIIVIKCLFSQSKNSII